METLKIQGNYGKEETYKTNARTLMEVLRKYTLMDKDIISFKNKLYKVYEVKNKRYYPACQSFENDYSSFFVFKQIFGTENIVVGRYFAGEFNDKYKKLNKKERGSFNIIRLKNCNF